MYTDKYYTKTDALICIPYPFIHIYICDWIYTLIERSRTHSTHAQSNAVFSSVFSPQKCTWNFKRNKKEKEYTNVYNVVCIHHIQNT